MRLIVLCAVLFATSPCDAGLFSRLFNRQPAVKKPATCPGGKCPLPQRTVKR